MHRCAMCALLLTTQPPHPDDDYTTFPEFHPDQIHKEKVMKMALTHDLCEAIAGDVTPFCKKEMVLNKQNSERLAMEEIRKVVGDPLGLELFELWKEYEEQTSIEALYCKDIDKFEMIMQAYEYEEEHLIMNEKKDGSNSSSNGGSRNGVVKDDEDGSVIVKKKQKIEENNNGGHDETVQNGCIEPLRSFYITTNGKMKSPLFKRLDAELRQKREHLLKERGWEVTDKERLKS